MDLIGTVLWNQKALAESAISSYKRFKDGITPFIDELKTFGTNMDEERLRNIKERFFEPLIEELKTSIKEDIEKQPVPVWQRPLLQRHSDETEQALRKLLSRFSDHLNSYRLPAVYNDPNNKAELFDIPFIDGLPIISEKFEMQVRDRCICKIKDQREAKLYRQFLDVQKQFKQLIESGFTLDYHFTMHHKDGLDILRIPE